MDIKITKELKYYAIYQDIRAKILSYKLKPGTQLLGFRELMQHYNVSYSTISRALKRLMEEGLIWTEQGKGIFVTQEACDVETVNNDNIIGVIVTNIDIPYFNIMMKEIEKEMADKGYEIIIRSSDFSSVLEKDIVQTFIDKNIKGLIVIPTFDENDSDFLEYIDGKKINIIYMLRYKHNYNSSFIVSDEYDGATMAVNHLVEMGHSKIGYISGELIKARDLKFKALCDYMAGRGLEVNHNWVLFGKYFEVDTGYNMMKQMLKCKELPTAVFCYTDNLAVGAIKACKEFGIRVPEDISFVGYNDDEIASLIEPQLTTISVPISTMCRLAVSSIIDAISREEVKENDRIQIKAPVKLIDRNSVKDMRKN